MSSPTRSPAETHGSSGSRSPVERAIESGVARSDKMAFLVACAAALQILESQLPHPIPGVRLGLANVLTLVALVDLGFAAAIQVAVLRTIIASFVLGTFLSPTFLLSLSGSLTSGLLMGSCYLLLERAERPLLSLVGVSLVGASCHALVQFFLVYAFLVRHDSLFVLLPWLGLGAVATGWISGSVASRACRELPRPVAGMGQPAPLPVRASSPSPAAASKPEEGARAGPGPSAARVPASLAIGGFLALTILALGLDSLRGLSWLLALLLTVAALARGAIGHWLTMVRRLWLFLAVCSTAPVWLIDTGNILVHWAFLAVTSAGLETGAKLLLRLLGMMLGASLVTTAFSPGQLVLALAPLLVPLRLIGLPGHRAAAIVVRALDTIPDLSSRISALVSRELGLPGGLRRLVPSLAALMAQLYLQGDRSRRRVPEASPGETVARSLGTRS